MKIFVITGAANGLGYALTKGALAAGHAVIGVDLGLSDIAHPALTHLTLDLTASHTHHAILAALPNGCDTVIHCAGISATGPFQDIPADRHRAVIDLNLTAPLTLTTALLGAGKLAPDGTLAFIASLSCLSGYPGATSYAASKDGLAAFARGLTGAGYKTLTVFPGPLDTNHARKYAPDNSDATVARRLSTTDAAAEILRAITRGKRTVIPGTSAKVIGMLARIAPALVEKILVRSLFKDMDRVRT